MFADREDAARRLAAQLRPLPLVNPLVLAIPRGGVVIGAVLARELGADLDVVLARKLRAPYQPELALGAVGEDGELYLNRSVVSALGVSNSYLEHERRHQLDEIARRQALYRAARPQAPLSARSLILTDDGIATGSTMIAALHYVRGHDPREVIVAVPVAPPERLEAIEPLCDRLICLMAPPDFYAVGQFYESFEPIDDEEVLRLLRQFAPQGPSAPEPGHQAG